MNLQSPSNALNRSQALEGLQNIFALIWMVPVPSISKRANSPFIGVISFFFFSFIRIANYIEFIQYQILDKSILASISQLIWYALPKICIARLLLCFYILDEITNRYITSSEYFIWSTENNCFHTIDAPFACFFVSKKNLIKFSLILSTKTFNFFLSEFQDIPKNLDIRF